MSPKIEFSSDPSIIKSFLQMFAKRGQAVHSKDTKMNAMKKQQLPMLLKAKPGRENFLK